MEDELPGASSRDLLQRRQERIGVVLPIVRHRAEGGDIGHRLGFGSADSK